MDVVGPSGLVHSRYQIWESRPGDRFTCTDCAMPIRFWVSGDRRRPLEGMRRTKTWLTVLVFGVLATACGDADVSTPRLEKLALVESGEVQCGSISVDINQDRNVVSSSLGHTLVSNVGIDRYGISPECLTIFAITEEMGDGFANILSMPVSRPTGSPPDVGGTTLPLLAVWLGDGDRAEVWELPNEVQGFHKDVAPNANGDREGVNLLHSDGSIEKAWVVVSLDENGGRTATSLVLEFSNRSAPVSLAFGQS